MRLHAGISSAEILSDDRYPLVLQGTEDSRYEGAPGQKSEGAEDRFSAPRLLPIMHYKSMTEYRKPCDDPKDANGFVIEDEFPDAKRYQT